MTQSSYIRLSSQITNNLHACVDTNMVKNKKELRFEENDVDTLYELLLPSMAQVVREFIQNEADQDGLEASILYFFSDPERSFRLFHQFLLQDPSIQAMRNQSVQEAETALKDLDERLATHKKSIQSFQGVKQLNGVAMIELDMMQTLCLKFVRGRVFELAIKVASPDEMAPARRFDKKLK